MAGSYPDAPANRIPLDLHGGAIINLSSLVQQPLSTLQGVTGESGWLGIGAGGGDVTFAFLFPYNIDISHLYVAGYRVSVTLYSTDTTNGVDGTWLSFPSVVPVNGGGAPDQRSNITAMSIPNCKAIRILADSSATQAAYVLSFHIYGLPAAGQNPDRLELWHPTLDQRVSGAHFDWGDVPRGSSSDKQFRIKNRSDTLTANSTVVSVSALTEASPLFAPTHTLSTNGTTFHATVAVSTISPGAISPIITLRRTTPADAQVSLWTARVTATATTWT